MVKRKIFQEKKQKPVSNAPAPKKARRGLDIDGLPDAIVEGRLVVPLGTEVYIPRLRSGRNTVSVCLIKSLAEDGLLQVWDETLAQWFSFKLDDGVVVKVSKVFTEKKDG